ncbi:MAG TPA: hypothetical protein VGX28_10570 [Frankiaceae bacterium]|nr:hypothetical protein [Frankiaceae bacterium]
MRNERATATVFLRRLPGKAHVTLDLDAEAATYRLTHVSGRWAVREVRRRLKAAGLAKG